jgi:hypothetical protein
VSSTRASLKPEPRVRAIINARPGLAPRHSGIDLSVASFCIPSPKKLSLHSNIFTVRLIVSDSGLRAKSKGKTTKILRCDELVFHVPLLMTELVLATKRATLELTKANVNETRDRKAYHPTLLSTNENNIINVTKKNLLRNYDSV